ncbi:MAG: TonB family protein [Pseudomonadota bacterium]
MNDGTSSNTVLTRDLLPVANGRDDKLPPMLFVSALLWAILILGITFEAGVLTDSGDTTSLEVTIVAQQQQTSPPDKADYIAQEDQQGHGNTRESVDTPAASARAGSVAPPAEQTGPEQSESTLGEPIDQALLTSDGGNRVQFQPDDPSELVDDAARLAQSMPTGIDQTLPLPENVDPSVLIQDDNPRHLVVSVNTKRSDLAPYLSAWKQRVERIGTQSFINNLEANGRDGSPIIAVSILPDGSLGNTEILRSSGDRILDQAALVIVNRAAPFAPFPAQIAESRDMLRFAYKFRFRSGRVTGAVAVDAP